MSAGKHGEGKKFFHISGGKLKSSTGKKDEAGKNIYEDFDYYEGTLVGLEKYEDKYEDKPQNKLRITMRDDKTGEIADISVTDETFFIPAFFSRLINIEIDQPFLLGVMPSEQNEKMSFCYMKQFGKKIEKDKDFPGPDKVDLGKGKTGYNWTKVSEKTDHIIAEVNGFLKTASTESTPAEEEGWPKE